MLPFLFRLTHTRMQLILSLVGGLMLGIGLFHMLPHSVGETGSLDVSIWWMMIGLLAMFFLIRAFHFHQHGAAEFEDPVSATDPDHADHADQSTAAAAASQTGSDRCDHDHHAHHSHSLNWMGVAFGLSVHTMIDGLALGASVQADYSHSPGYWLAGLGTFLAIVLHKPLDAVSITTLMTAGGWSARQRHLCNAAFATMCPIGALLFFLGIERFSESQHLVVGGALAFSAGVFLCISLGDLLPELEFHSHDRFKLSVTLLMGVGLAYLIGFLEPEHVHSGQPQINHQHESHDDSHSDDGHQH